jgi:carboxylesterase type B
VCNALSHTHAIPHTATGIPFAEPPIGALRLQPPVGKFSLGQETFHATTFGPACIQVVRLAV